MLFTVNEIVIFYCNHAIPWSFSKYVFLSLCLFLSWCFHALMGIRLEPTEILFKWPYVCMMLRFLGNLLGHSIQGRMEVWKSGGGDNNLVGIICPPYWNRVHQPKIGPLHSFPPALQYPAPEESSIIFCVLFLNFHILRALSFDRQSLTQVYSFIAIYLFKNSSKHCWCYAQ